MVTMTVLVPTSERKKKDKKKERLLIEIIYTFNEFIDKMTTSMDFCGLFGHASMNLNFIVSGILNLVVVPENTTTMLAQPF